MKYTFNLHIDTTFDYILTRREKKNYTTEFHGEIIEITWQKDKSHRKYKNKNDLHFGTLEL